jgi:hypothetical protein
LVFWGDTFFVVFLKGVGFLVRLLFAFFGICLAIRA